MGHGVLAYALLAALGEKGEPQAPTTPEGIITMMSLLQYVNQQVPELTEKYEGGEKQYPVSASTGMDFPPPGAVSADHLTVEDQVATG